MLYFSVVTLTTLGFGDIAPTNSAVGQSLVIGEVLIGVVGIAYLTALVIRRLL
jgi:voltage-gated potassium channel Kch